MEKLIGPKVLQSITLHMKSHDEGYENELSLYNFWTIMASQMRFNMQSLLRKVNILVAKIHYKCW